MDLGINKYCSVLKIPEETAINVASYSVNGDRFDLEHVITHLPRRRFLGKEEVSRSVAATLSKSSIRSAAEPMHVACVGVFSLDGAPCSARSWR